MVFPCAFEQELLERVEVRLDVICMVLRYFRALLKCLNRYKWCLFYAGCALSLLLQHSLI